MLVADISDLVRIQAQIWPGMASSYNLGYGTLFTKYSSATWVASFMLFHIYQFWQHSVYFFLVQVLICQLYIFSRVTDFAMAAYRISPIRLRWIIRFGAWRSVLRHDMILCYQLADDSHIEVSMPLRGANLCIRARFFCVPYLDLSVHCLHYDAVDNQGWPKNWFICLQ